MASKTGLILEGGAIRGIFTAGVLDCMIDKGVEFPYVSGVSVGVSNASGFMSRQKGRSKKVLTHENTKTFYGLPNLLRTGKMVDLDACIIKYALENFPYDFETYHKSNALWEVVVVNCMTGQPEYISEFKDDMETLEFCKASCSLPFICKPVSLRGNMYLDGSLADSLPVARALEQGCEKIVLVLTKAEMHEATDYRKFKPLIKMIYGKYPKLVDTILSRKEKYIEQMALIEELEKQGRVMIIKPWKTQMSHFETNKKKLEDAYVTGYDIMESKYAELVKFMNE